ncbi:MAG: hypothetical protein F6K25_04670 [Okeania sp. SIO2G4]|uniref:DUF5615 family PIN-like protein n=1 Tax=unclassified Okeania TaxID=2634635 RepID=UPI0013BA7D8E|nr:MULTISPECIES: DUF5615 family PIN-like protein [unclassified Okeania]NEP07426.1 hypothetical protein [Okeania sp. SIO4D6]NEP42105.1 hypothetical protein [Okeania sp. SIO2H7]NEP73988.1 hypothetical protein [Okeania sp. SIO2G5]NEP92610.1 hypothetical protein [Okeania sp. SIO2F5]NEQ90061.1 hypothetical protein [Okeania sp. SIO2G4]
MSKIRLYLDEDTMDNDFLRALRLRNVDVLSAGEAQMLSCTDEEQLKWALDNQRIIYSFNVRDFYRIHTNLVKQGQQHAGIILSIQSYSIGEQMRRLLRIIASISAEEMANQIEFLSAWGEQ